MAKPKIVPVKPPQTFTPIDSAAQRLRQQARTKTRTGQTAQAIDAIVGRDRPCD